MEEHSLEEENFFHIEKCRVRQGLGLKFGSGSSEK